jgi:hypothetical protein
VWFADERDELDQQTNRGRCEGGAGVFLKEGCTVKAAREMPRPCVEDVTQAQGNLPVANNSLTRALQAWRIIVK